MTLRDAVSLLETFGVYKSLYSAGSLSLDDATSLYCDTNGKWRVTYGERGVLTFNIDCVDEREACELFVGLVFESWVLSSQGHEALKVLKQARNTVPDERRLY